MPPCKISVVLPCYNVSHYIERVVNCLKRQSLQDFEAIFINDGSTDDTLAIIKKQINGLCHFTVYDFVNQGLSQARNEGIKLAKGAYLYFLDPDDLIEDFTFEYIYSICVLNDCDAVQFAYRIVYLNGLEKEGKNGNKRVGPYSKMEIYKELLPRFLGHSISEISMYGTTAFNNYYEFNAVWRFLYKRDVVILNNIRFPEGVSIIEDKIFNCRFFCYAKKIWISDKVLYTYMVRESGLLYKSFMDSQTFVQSKLDRILENLKLRDLYLGYHGIDIRPLYAGTPFLTSLELCDRLTKKRDKNIKDVLVTYLSNHEVKLCVDMVPYEGPLVLKVLLYFVKHKNYRLLITLFRTANYQSYFGLFAIWDLIVLNILMTLLRYKCTIF